MSSKIPYRYCGVPGCKNNTFATPNKLFIRVSDKNCKKWCNLARRDVFAARSKCHFCEDHFDLPNDMENYTEYKVMGSVKRISMKPGCMPTKFHCQPDRLKRMSAPITERSVITKKRKLAVLDDALKRLETLTREPTPPPAIPVEMPLTDTTNNMAEKGVQANITIYRRSKSTQTAVTVVSPLKVEFASCSASPAKVQPYTPIRNFNQPPKVMRWILVEESEAEAFQQYLKFKNLNKK